jgi:hypothetical protein
MNAEQALAVLEQAAITQEHAERAVSADGDIEAARRAFQRIASNLSGAQEARAFFADLVKRETAMQAAIEKVCRRMQMDIDDGSRPDQWSMQDMQWTLRDAAKTKAEEPQT